MKRNWSEPELEEFWTLSPDELKLAFGLVPSRQLGLALQIKFLQIEGCFPGSRRDIPAVAVRHVSEQIGVHQKHFAVYDMEGRTAQRDRVSIRKLSGYRESNEADKKRLVTWLCTDNK